MDLLRHLHRVSVREAVPRRNQRPARKHQHTPNFPLTQWIIKALILVHLTSTPSPICNLRVVRLLSVTETPRVQGPQGRHAFSQVAQLGNACDVQCKTPGVRSKTLHTLFSLSTLLFIPPTFLQTNLTFFFTSSSGPRRRSQLAGDVHLPVPATHFHSLLPLQHFTFLPSKVALLRRVVDGPVRCSSWPHHRWLRLWPSVHRRGCPESPDRHRSSRLSR